MSFAIADLAARLIDCSHQQVLQSFQSGVCAAQDAQWDQVRKPLEHASEAQHAVATAGGSHYLLLVGLQANL